MCKRIARRAHELGVSPRELSRDELAALCTVTISRFYRDRAVFDCLGARVLPALAEAALARGATALDCWSAGCASGEEPYTLTIQWQAALAPRFPTLEPRVLGTDIDQYAATAFYTSVNQGTVALAAGTRTFRFTTTTRNAGNTGSWWNLSVDKIVLTPQ